MDFSDVMCRKYDTDFGGCYKLFQECFCLVGLFFLAACSTAVFEKDLDKLTITTATGQQLAYQIEIANTHRQRRRGLMHRRHMPAEHGMLLDFKKQRQVSIWMKNTLIPLDIIFINAAGIITKIINHAEPESTKLMSSDVAVRAVLELNAGQVFENSISVGDQLRHEIFKTGI